MQRVDFKNIEITGGFWKQKQELVKNTTVWAVYDRFLETGRFEALKCNKDAEKKAHIFWDSDVAKWIEGAAYLLSKELNPKLESLIDEMISDIAKNQEECGYFNSYYLVNTDEIRFTRRDNHELYCLGHFIEAAIAYYEATGKKTLIDVVYKYVDYVIKRFVVDKDTGFETPGHEEIELALVRLYELSGEQKHLDLAKHFVFLRGDKSKLTDWANERYNQSHASAYEQNTAEGHSVRATYFYSSMADLALKTGDERLKNACVSIFDDIINYKMYITGGIGSSSAGEAFTVKYDLPNLLAYTESCAAIGLVYFAQRMLLLTNDAKYANIIERVLYNGFLASLSLDGKAFFYCNPLEIYPEMITRDSSVVWKSLNLPVTQRQEVFECSCCPPNIVRFIPSIANYLYTVDENAVYLHQFISSNAKIMQGGNEVEIEQESSYPFGNKAKIKIKKGKTKLYVRISEHCTNKFENVQNGYGVFDVCQGDEIELDFDISPKFIESSPNVLANVGKCAVMKGPIVYCLEAHDNEQNIKNIYLDTESKITEGYNEALGVPTLTLDAFYKPSTNTLYAELSKQMQKTSATMIPYFAFANRGEAQMLVWCLYR